MQDTKKRSPILRWHNQTKRFTDMIQARPAHHPVGLYHDRDAMCLPKKQTRKLQDAQAEKLTSLQANK